MKTLLLLLLPLMLAAQNNLSGLLEDNFSAGIGFSDRYVDRASVEAGVYHKKLFVALGVGKDLDNNGRKEYETTLQISQVLYSSSGVNFSISTTNSTTNDFFHTYNRVGLSYLFNDIKDYECYKTKRHSRFSNIFSPSIEFGYMHHSNIEEEVNQENSRWLIQPGFDVIVSNIIGSIRYSEGSIKVKLMILI